MARSIASSALPRGLRIRRHRRPVWLGALAIAGAGVVLGGTLLQASTTELLGALVVLLAVATSFYRPAISVALLAFTYPFDLRTFAGPVKLTTSAALIAIIVLTWVIRQVLPNAPAWRATPLDLPVLIFAAATLLSVVGLGGHLQNEAVGLLKAAGGFLIFFIATQSLRSWDDVWLVVGAILAAGLVQAAVTAAPVFNGTYVPNPDIRASGALFDPNLFSGYLVLVIPVAVAIGVAFRWWWVVPLTVAVALVFTVALVLTLSRSGWLGLLGATGLLLILLPARRWRVLAVAGSVAAILLLVGLSGLIGTRLGPTDSPFAMLTNRSEVWAAAFWMTIHHPLGVGVANFQYFYTEFSGRTDGLNHAHNLFLNMSAERGFIGLVAFAVVVVVLFQTLGTALRHKERLFHRALLAGLIAAFGGYLVHSIFEVSYYDYKVLLLFWLLAGIGAVLPMLSAARAADVEAAVLTPGFARVGIRPFHA